MLERKELDRYGPPGFSLGQKEKDYLQYWMLSFFSRSGSGGVFKGGTCLQKAYGLPRYSEDLDFTLGDGPVPDFQALSGFLASTGIQATVKTSEANVSISAKIRCRGPLFNGNQISESTVSLDFSRRETSVLAPEPLSINSPYPDILPYSLKVMDRKEIAAEKIRAIFTRTSARDLFDLYFLIRSGVSLDLDLVGKKLEYYELKFSFLELEKRIAKLEKPWKTEMRALTPSPADYQVAAQTVLSEAGK